MITNSRDIIRRLEKEGWILARIRGSHHQFKNPRTGARLTVTHPRKDMPVGTALSIHRIAGWAKD